MTSRREFLQQVACAFTVAGVGCTIPDAIAKPQAEKPSPREVFCVGVIAPQYNATNLLKESVTIQYFEIAPGEAFIYGDAVFLDGAGLACRARYSSPSESRGLFVGVCIVPGYRAFVSRGDTYED